MKLLTPSNEDYLETIYLLSLDTNSVKSVRIAESLNVSRPAVNKAMNELLSMGFIHKSSYSEVSLTEMGLSHAKAIYSRHKIIKAGLIAIGVSEETAEKDCCKIEHVVSEETVEKLISFLSKMK